MARVELEPKKSHTFFPDILPTSILKAYFGQWIYPLLQFRKAPEGSSRKFVAQKQLAEAIAHRTHIDSSIKLIGKLLFGIEKGPEVLKAVRPTGKPLVDDWTCLKSLVRKLSICFCTKFHKPDINQHFLGQDELPSNPSG